jgi:5'-nucleotidase
MQEIIVMRILIANDDGIFSPGLIALAEVAEKFGDVLVMAPDVEQSAMGHAITIQRPLRYLPRLASINLKHTG